MAEINLTNPRKSYKIHHYLMLCLLMLLSGCQFFQKESIQQNQSVGNQQIVPFVIRQPKLLALNQWHLEGSLSIQQAGEMPVIASYEWRQLSSNHYQINLSAPLNLMSASISGQPGLVSLQSSRGISTQAGSVELLMQKVLGWSLPITHLVYWVRGLPATTDLVMDEHFDNYGHLIAFQQDGWTVWLSHYQTLAPILDLPQQIDLQRPGLTARIVIKNWSRSL